MKRALMILLTVCAFTAVYGQNYIYRGSQNAEQNPPAADTSTVIPKAPSLDSALLGQNIISILEKDSYGEGEVNIFQSGAIASGMNRYLQYNKTKKISGYRVRIFFDNKRTARTQSEECARSFSAEYPDIGVYRQYENPYFKVTVGDFRTKSDAMKFMNSIKNKYPGVFLVRETINYPL
ncbi:MAG: SPOR domain-containing protein [Bacteroidales bacterium]|nr:SPOR domain-containing protein [Bacteroidales bacterium]